MVSEFTQVILQIDGPRATLLFNRPERVNALTQTLINEALRASEHVAGLKDVRVLVVQGVGRAFSSGVDYKAAADPGYSKEALSGEARRLLHTWQTMPQVTIAAVRGACYAGGLSLAVGLDLLLCSEDAQFCDNHATLGLHSTWGMTQRLPRLIGVQRAREMSFTARRVSGREALDLGLVLDAVPVEELDARVDALANAIIAVSPGSVAAYKDLYRLSQNLSLDEGVLHEATARYRIEDRKARQATTFRGAGGHAPKPT
ncbi:enoyl-CoA hydratase/isomerase family protein [Phenylobacterium sp. SCN 70-31]|uniref:enoyl-CoA hydratase/isomerase family protein n=1 Tax=Phenylobacterium sp. SCN 70-31 TaxID=1660129 RepID=UPI00086C045E|nr:enoyl-CoA hydratase/isomerase family protein [Phenylobacterium sp. SCN 70-31]ODT88315.1 MAG: hypothetical protein ABS78_06740 [Phenylobacterium sp. SCN 70-31]